jgi:hypothetical protein
MPLELSITLLDTFIVLILLTIIIYDRKIFIVQAIGST